MKTFFDRTEPKMRGLLRFIYLIALALVAIQFALWQGWMQ